MNGMKRLQEALSVDPSKFYVVDMKRKLVVDGPYDEEPKGGNRDYVLSFVNHIARPDLGILPGSVLKAYAWEEKGK
jgi:hypothetical protein